LFLSEIGIFLLKLNYKKMTNQFIFNEALKLALDGRTNKWLCDKTGISPSELSRIVSGKLIPSDRQKKKIEEIFPSLKQN